MAAVPPWSPISLLVRLSLSTIAEWSLISPLISWADCVGNTFPGERCGKLGGRGALGGLGAVLASRAWSSGEARKRLHLSWYGLTWRGRFLLQGGCFAEEFPAMLRSADSQYAGKGSSWAWAEGRAASSWLKAAKNVAVMYCFIFSKGGGGKRLRCWGWNACSWFQNDRHFDFFFSLLFLEFGKQVVLLKYRRFSVSPVNGLL